MLYLIDHGNGVMYINNMDDKFEYDSYRELRKVFSLTIFGKITQRYLDHIMLWN